MTDAMGRFLCVGRGAGSPIRDVARRKLLLALEGWLRPPPDEESQHQNEDRAYVLILSNMVLVAIALMGFALGFQQWPQHRSAFAVFVIFALFESAVIATYWACGFWPDNTFVRFTRIMSNRDRLVWRQRKGLAIPLPVVVLPNIYAVSYLTYQTGGPSNSPYAQVLVAMLLAAPAKGVPEAVENESLLAMIWHAILAYRLIFVIAVLFYGPLLFLQALEPAKISPAPTGLTVGITGVVFVFSVVAGYVARATREK